MYKRASVAAISTPCFYIALFCIFCLAVHCFQRGLHRHQRQEPSGQGIIWVVFLWLFCDVAFDYMGWCVRLLDLFRCCNSAIIYQSVIIADFAAFVQRSQSCIFICHHFPCLFLLVIVTVLTRSTLVFEDNMPAFYKLYDATVEATCRNYYRIDQGFYFDA